MATSANDARAAVQAELIEIREMLAVEEADLLRRTKVEIAVRRQLDDAQAAFDTAHGAVQSKVVDIARLRQQIARIENSLG